jgi:hypothetical protein
MGILRNLDSLLWWYRSERVMCLSTQHVLASVGTVTPAPQVDIVSRRQPAFVRARHPLLTSIVHRPPLTTAGGEYARPRQKRSSEALSTIDRS